MGRLFDEEELQKYIMHDGCDKGCGYIDERDLKYIQTTEAIPKDQYEARLKADMLAMLTELQLEIEESENCGKAFHLGLQMASKIIQQKIDKLKEKDNGGKS